MPAVPPSYQSAEAPRIGLTVHRSAMEMPSRHAYNYPPAPAPVPAPSAFPSTQSTLLLLGCGSVVAVIALWLRSRSSASGSRELEQEKEREREREPTTQKDRDQKVYDFSSTSSDYYSDISIYSPNPNIMPDSNPNQIQIHEGSENGDGSGNAYDQEMQNSDSQFPTKRSLEYEFDSPSWQPQGPTYSYTFPQMRQPMSIPQPTISLKDGEQEDGVDEITPLAKSSTSSPPPRRRSYTKMQSGVEVQGEILVTDVWKRHTKVYGGGVCLACLESESKQKMIRA